MQRNKAPWDTAQNATAHFSHAQQQVTDSEDVIGYTVEWFASSGDYE